MKILIAEDDFTSRIVLQELLKSYGHSHVAVNGKEAIDAVKMALETNEPYDLICLDIMMPEMDGQAVLKEIRVMESSKGIAQSKPAKVIMTTAMADKDHVLEAINAKCDSFLAKPVQKRILLRELQRLRLI